MNIPMILRLRYVHILCFLLPAALIGCKKSADDIINKKMRIVTTTGMIKDAVEHVAQEHAEVVALMGPGVDPHLYKASQGDLNKLADADVIFYNGLHLEGKMGDVFEKIARVKTVIPVSGEMPDSVLREVPGAGSHDPHVWFDVKLWQQAVRTVAHTLMYEDSLHAETYRHNADRYIRQLDSLHTAVKETIAQIPVSQRVLITAHDAFGYFGDAYNIEVKGLQGISTVSEFGLKDRIDLVNFIITRKIKALFIETSVSDRAVKAVVDACKAKGWNVKIGGSLFSDAMGAAGTPEGTYVGMVHANVMTITNALK